MRKTSGFELVPIGILAAAGIAAGLFFVSPARADAVTDWNEFTVEATKGFDGSAVSAAVTLDTNVSSEVEAIEARAVFDAVNSIDHFNSGSYYYSATNWGRSPLRRPRPRTTRFRANCRIRRRIRRPLQDGPWSGPGWTPSSPAI